jgi:hypothetical protein
MQHFFDNRYIESESVGRIAQSKRAMRPRVTTHQFKHRLRHRFK